MISDIPTTPEEFKSAFSALLKDLYAEGMTGDRELLEEIELWHKQGGHDDLIEENLRLLETRLKIKQILFRLARGTYRLSDLLAC